MSDEDLCDDEDSFSSYMRLPRVMGARLAQGSAADGLCPKATQKCTQPRVLDAHVSMTTSGGPELRAMNTQAAAALQQHFASATGVEEALMGRLHVQLAMQDAELKRAQCLIDVTSFPDLSSILRVEKLHTMPIARLLFQMQNREV